MILDRCVLPIVRQGRVYEGLSIRINPSVKTAAREPVADIRDRRSYEIDLIVNATAKMEDRPATRRNKKRGKSRSRIEDIGRKRVSRRRFSCVGYAVAGSLRVTAEKPFHG